MASRQCMLAMELQNIERENFDGSLTKFQNFLVSINCAIHYVLAKFYSYTSIYILCVVCTCVYL